MSEIASCASLLARIEQFREQKGLSATQFGKDSVNDKSLVRNLMDGRSPTLRTVAKIEAFMAEYVPQQAAA